MTSPVPREGQDRPICAAEPNVAAALSALPAEYSSVIVETFYRRRSVPDTAERLGVSADTVKVRCYEALRELKHALAERGARGVTGRLRHRPEVNPGDRPAG